MAMGTPHFAPGGYMLEWLLSFDNLFVLASATCASYCVLAFCSSWVIVPPRPCIDLTIGLLKNHPPSIQKQRSIIRNRRGISVR